MELIKKLSPFLLATSLAGCSLNVAPLDIERLGPTLLVRNRSLEPLSIRTERGRRIGTAMPGENKCLSLNGVGSRSIALNFRYHGRNYYTPEFNPMNTSEGGWRMDVGNLPKFEVLSLQPHKRCNYIRR